MKTGDHSSNICALTIILSRQLACEILAQFIKGYSQVSKLVCRRNKSVSFANIAPSLTDDHKLETYIPPCRETLQLAL
jgi:hypothetical protein